MNDRIKNLIKSGIVDKSMLGRVDANGIVSEHPVMDGDSVFVNSRTCHECGLVDVVTIHIPDVDRINSPAYARKLALVLEVAAFVQEAHLSEISDKSDGDKPMGFSRSGSLVSYGSHETCIPF